MKNFLIIFLAFTSNLSFSQLKLPGNFIRITKFIKKENENNLKKIILQNSYENCIAFSNNVGYCNEATEICDIFNRLEANLVKLGGPAKIFKNLGLFNVIKPYCGNGICYQCCWTNSGCHTSFIGFPVLNCNQRYGLETTAAGLTLIVEENPEPGQACLFTQQTCEHLPICNSQLKPEEIRIINNNPNHVMKSKIAIEQRAYSFANYGLESGLNEFLNQSIIGKPLTDKNGKVLINQLSENDFNDFLYGRGHSYYEELKENIEKINENTITSGLGIKDTITNEFLRLPSMWNITRQLFLLRYLTMIPNLYNRLAFVESKIWTEEDKASYLKSAGINDSTFSKFIHPIGLSILSKNFGTQDYRLLGVPLPGEEVQSNFFNGDILGQPTMVKLEELSESKFSVKIEKSGTHSIEKKLPILVLWGDGSSSHGYTKEGESIEFDHNYSVSGEYRIIVITWNSSGLRSVFFKNITRQQKGNFILPVPSSITFQNFKTYTSIFTFANYIAYDIYGQNNQNKEFKIGSSKAVYLGNAGDKLIDSLLVAENHSFESFNKIIIRPYHLYDSEGYIRMEIPTLMLSVFNNSNMNHDNVELKINPSNLKFYDANNKLLDSKNLIVGNTTGGVNVYIYYGDTKVDKIEIPIPDDLLKQLATKPNTLLNKEIQGIYTENTLNDFFKVEPLLSNEPTVQNIPYVKIYPNPFEERIIFNRTNKSLEQSHLRIYNSSGRLAKEITIPSSQDYYEFDFSELEGGSYIWVYEEKNKKTINGKIVKQ